MLRNAVPDEPTSAEPPVVIRSPPPQTEATGIQPNSEQVCLPASKLPWQTRFPAQMSCGLLAWLETQTVHRRKEPPGCCFQLKVEAAAPPPPSSYLNTCQPNRVASRWILILPSRVGCSYSIQLNKWIPEAPPPKKKKIPTKAAPLIMVRAALWSPGQFKKCPTCVWRRSGMVPMLESSWEQMSQWPAVPYLHWRRRSYRLAQSGSSQAKRSARSLFLSLRLSLTGHTRTTSFLLYLFHTVRLL